MWSESALPESLRVADFYVHELDPYVIVCNTRPVVTVTQAATSVMHEDRSLALVNSPVSHMPSHTDNTSSNVTLYGL